MPEDADVMMGRAKRILLGRRNLAVASTLVTSLSNFTVTLVGSRILQPEVFGLFAVVLTATYFVVGLQRGTVCEPLLATEPARRTRTMLSGVVALAITFAAALAILVTVLAQINALPAVLALGAAMLVLQDAGRYNAFAGGRYGLALSTDAVMMAVQVSLLVVIVAMSPGSLHAVAWSWAGANAVGAVLIHVRLRDHPRLSGAREFIAHNKKLSSWILGQFLLGAGISQAVPLVLVPLVGATEYGALRVSQTLFMPLATAAVAAQPLLLLWFARKHGTSTDRVRLEQALKGASIYFAIGCVFVIPIVGFRETIMDAVFGAAYREYGTTAAVVGISTLVMASVAPIGAAMRVLRQGRQIFAGQLTGTLIAIATVPALAASYGALGAALGLLAQAVAIAATSTILAVATVVRRTEHAGRDPYSDGPVGNILQDE